LRFQKIQLVFWKDWIEISPLAYNKLFPVQRMYNDFLFHDRLIAEKNAFLAEARRKIKGFPPDYRPMLRKVYEDIAFNLQNLMINRPYVT
jgi:hypothetical protein